MENMDRPLLVFTFQGVLGDLCKTSFWSKEPFSIENNLKTRVAFVRGMK
jgi:hypothetical protein